MCEEWVGAADAYEGGSLLDIVIGQAGAELSGIAGNGRAIVEIQSCNIESRAGRKILLERNLVGSVCLRLSAWSKANTRNAITTLDGNAVCGERPLVAQRTTGAGCHGLLATNALIAKECLVSINKSLNVWCGLFVNPCWEVCLSLIDLAGPGRTVIHIHGDLDVVAILLNGRKILNLLEAALVGLTGSHAAVNGD